MIDAEKERKILQECLDAQGPKKRIKVACTALETLSHVLRMYQDEYLAGWKDDRMKKAIAQAGVSLSMMELLFGDSSKQKADYLEYLSTAPEVKAGLDFGWLL